MYGVTRFQLVWLVDFQVDEEGRADAQHGSKTDPDAHLLDQRLGYVQAQSGAAAARGEEGEVICGR